MLKHIFKTGERPSEELHRLIEAKDWDAVMVRIETHSPELRKLATCPVLFDTFKRSSALPLTNALCNHAPLAVIVKLLDDYPKAIDCTDTAYDRMPLSLALLHCAPENVIMELLVRCPRAASLQDRLRRTALHYAIGNKHPMIVIDHLLELFPDAVEKRDHRGWLPLHVACARGAPITLVKNLCERDPSSIFIGDNNGLIPKDFIEHVAEGVRNDEVYDYLHRVTPTLSGFKFNFSGQLLGHRTGAGGWKSEQEHANDEAMKKREQGRGNKSGVVGRQVLGAGGSVTDEMMKKKKDRDEERGNNGPSGDLA